MNFKLVVLNWLKDFLLVYIGRTIEILFRAILFFLPLGVYLLLIQMRKKASKTSSISVFMTDDSTWQHIFPGFILVSVDSKSLKRSTLKFRNNVQSWVAANRYIIGILFMLLIVTLMLIKR